MLGDIHFIAIILLLPPFVCKVDLYVLMLLFRQLVSQSVICETKIRMTSGDSGGRIKVQQISDIGGRLLLVWWQANSKQPKQIIATLSKHLNSKTPDSINLGPCCSHQFFSVNKIMKQTEQLRQQETCP